MHCATGADCSKSAEAIINFRLDLYIFWFDNLSILFLPLSLSLSSLPYTQAISRKKPFLLALFILPFNGDEEYIQVYHNLEERCPHFSHQFGEMLFFFCPKKEHNLHLN